MDEISGEMYKRQNTSVAYQAPEGKTYVADLRQVYDFYTGRPKTGIKFDVENPLSLFENTILQDISSDKVTSSSDIGFSNVHQEAIFNPYNLHNFPPNPYAMQYTNAMPVPPAYSGAVSFGPSSNSPTPTYNYKLENSLGNSPTTTVSSPSPQSSSFNDSVEQISPNKSIHSDEFHIMNPPIHQVFKVESTTIDEPTTREPKVEAVMDYRPKSTKPTLKRKRSLDEIERIEKESKIKKCKRDLKNFEIELDKNAPPPNVSLPTTQPKPPKTVHKHSIKSILNLDESEDLVNGPPVVDLGEQQMFQQIPAMQGTFPGAHYPPPTYLGMYSNPYQAAYMSHFGQFPFLAQQAFSSTPKYV